MKRMVLQIVGILVVAGLVLAVLGPMIGQVELALLAVAVVVGIGVVLWRGRGQGRRQKGATV